MNEAVSEGAHLTYSGRPFQSSVPTSDNVYAWTFVKWTILGEGPTGRSVFEECNWHTTIHWEKWLEKYEGHEGL